MPDTLAFAQAEQSHAVPRLNASKGHCKMLLERAAGLRCSQEGAHLQLLWGEELLQPCHNLAGVTTPQVRLQHIPYNRQRGGC